MRVQCQSDWFKRLALLLVVTMMASSLSAAWSPRYASAAAGPELSDLGKVIYGGGHNPVTLAPDVKVNGDGTFSGGFIKFKVEDAKPSENLSVKRVQDPDKTAGAISIVGDAVYLGNGTVAKQVGSINSVNNGQGGKELQIDFATPLVNGDFERGSDFGWTITKSKVTLGALASKTQGKPVTVSGTGPYTVSGNVVNNGAPKPYSFSTDFNYSPSVPGGRASWGNEGVERNLNGAGNFNATVNTENDNKILRLWFSGNLVSGSNANNAYGTVFGPDAVSTPFEASAGESLAFDWKAENGGDDYEVYGFLYNVDTEQYTELMYGRGFKQNWTTSRGIIPADGNYQFRFVAGSYDRTGGYALGASLYIDNVRVLSNSVTKLVVQDVAKLVSYENTSVTEGGQRKISVTLQDAELDKDTGLILVDLVATGPLSNKLSEIINAGLDESEYTPSRWAELQKAITDAQTVLSNPDATQEQVNEALGKLNTAKDTLVDKADLQAKQSEIAAEALNGNHYTQGSWTALEAAQAAAAQALADANVSQKEVDAILAELTAARAALVVKKELQDRVTAIGNENLAEADYKPENWQKLQNALAEANHVLSNRDAAPSDINAALAKLDAARASLVDKAALQSRTDDLHKLKPNQYDADRWESMKSALDAADAVLANDKATQTEADAALDRLNEVKAVLVDKTALQERVAELKPLNPDDYTPENFQLLQDAMDDAEAVLDDPEATQVDVKDALSKLNAARQGLVDKDGLSGAKNRIEAESLNPEHYTQTSWNALQQQLNDAQAVLDNDDATQRAVDAAKASLNAARDALVNKHALQQKTDEVNELQEADYLPANWTVLQEALAGAEQVLNNPSASQQQIDAALAHLKAAREALVDREALQAKVDEVETLEEADYAPEAWQTLEEALAEAHAVLNDPNTTQVAADAAREKLDAARLALVDKTELQAKYDEIIAEKLTRASYSTDSWRALEAALAEAKIVLDKANPVPAEVAAALSKLKEAREGLKPAPYYPSGPSVPTNSNSNPNNNGGKQIITVDVVTGAENEDGAVQVDLERTKHEDGRLTDQVTLTSEKVQAAADKAAGQPEKTVRIVLPDAKDEVSEVKVDVPSSVISILKNSQLDLEIDSSNGTVKLPSSSLEGVGDAIYFRLTPVKDEKQRGDLEQRVATSEEVQQLAGTDKVKVVSRPVKMESNLTDRPVTVTLPLTGVKLPSGSAERAAFLKELAVYIEHENGGKSLVEPEIVTLENGEQALRFATDKFGTLSIVHREADDAGTHKAYIHAYPDGKFRPDQSVTRAEMAAMLVRLSGFEDNELKGKAFADVSSAHWASKLIVQASDADLMKGYTDGSFKPDGSITRAEMAAVIYNQLKLAKSDETVGFADVSDAHWASGMIAAIKGTGLMPALADGTFKPGQELTRAEAVTILNRLFNRGPLYGMPTPSWPDANASHPAYFDIEEASTDHGYMSREEGGELWTAHK
ncbi:S-layer homology domain-containing protein [Paenibacillus pinihumi]|uniref:S-layer homology domain-containing protein n=1 Tax=Paenibacillus pinihumi TaxID=669462 RepID=UPI00041F481D|nr:S-layer homology domain-containing protein [Paenibacillus pinihumi]